MNAVELMLVVIGENTPKTIWTDTPLESFRQVPNTNRGDIGEQFILRYLQGFDILTSPFGSRSRSLDIEIEHKSFEVKTASEDTSGNFQFNHIRLDRPYDFLLCLGVRPFSLVFNAWSKGEVAEGKAGHLVRMAEGQSVTFKLTKRPDKPRPVEDLPSWIRLNLGRT